jgi:hypothetical protein
MAYRRWRFRLIGSVGSRRRQFDPNGRGDLMMVGIWIERIDEAGDWVELGIEKLLAGSSVCDGCRDYSSIALATTSRAKLTGSSHAQDSRFRGCQP